MDPHQKDTPENQQRKYLGQSKTKVEITAMSHYARKDIGDAMFKFCKNRETIANFNNKYFAKRPDYLDYPTDIINQVRSGATSFHCSEELWSNPREINTNMTPEEYNEIKIGWDLLIDIDSKYLDYSKIAARLLTGVLEHHGIKNIGIKFSGSKGFHILVPFKAFPKSIGGDLTKDHFPEWPRYIAGYLFEAIKDKMNDEILKLSTREELEFKGELITEHLCPNCKKPTITKKVGTYECTDKIRCKGVVESMTSNRKEIICSNCNAKMLRVLVKEVHFCETCKINSSKAKWKTSTSGGVTMKPQVEFQENITTRSAEDSVDIILVSPRHLFRVPYSLHEKTAFASIVLDKNELENFKPSDAEPLKISVVKSFMPDSFPDEAKELLLQALDWGRKNTQEPTKKYEGAPIDLKGLTFTEEMFPPIIKKILEGIKTDGRKRALSLMLSFFTSLGFPKDFIDEKITEWNKKNYHPLKEGYIRSQVDWHIKNKRLPPNYDKPIYKEFGIHSPPIPGMKNPINYTIKMALKNSRESKKATSSTPKNKE
ncbi:MAG: hypothetical protein IH845_01630 [Nanoarchaeota archaeon]|nr:hypothetical protein [Nanoarchaeota archaeon]